MIHLSFLLLLLQYCSRFIFHFIIFIFSLYLSFFYYSHYIIFVTSFLFIYLLFFKIFIFTSISSPPRYSVVNVVLIFNDSLIILAPSSPILLSVHISFYHFYFFSFFFFFIVLLFSLYYNCNFFVIYLLFLNIFIFHFNSITTQIQYPPWCYN